MIENTRVDARTHFKGPGDDDGPLPSSCGDLSWLTPLPDSMNFVFAFAYVSFVSIVAEYFF
jgi:hypothetical protein